MKLISVMVMTADGKITKGGESDVGVWASPEDQDHFWKLKRKYKTLIVGSETYEVIKDKLVLEKGILRIVLTRNPNRYKKAEKKEQLEFTSNTPRQLLKGLERRGRKVALLLGGGMINKLFFEQDLVDEMYLTVEPKLFAFGRPLIAESNVSINLKLIDSKQLNKQGTMLLHYKVIHNDS